MRLDAIVSAFIACSFAANPVQDLVFPITHTSRGIPGITLVTPEGHRHIFQIDTRSNGGYLSDSIPDNITSLTIVGSNSLIEVGTDWFAHSSISAALGVIGVARDSRFARMFPSIMLLPPISSDGARIIAAPQNPEQHCFGGEISYVETSGGIVQARVDIVSPQNTVTVPVTSPMAEFVIRTGEANDYIPVPVYAELISIIASHVRIEFGSSTQLMGCTTELFNVLPTIRFTIARENQNRLMPVENGLQIFLRPEDYLDMFENDVCVLRLREGRIFNVISANFISKVGIHFDYNHFRVGFCDPL